MSEVEVPFRLRFVLLVIVFLVVVLPARAQAQAVVEHFAGSTGGPGIRDDVGAEARFYTPAGVWANTTDIYVADQTNATIRKISIATGEVTTVAGSPQQKGTVDGIGDQARFSFPGALWGDGSFLYVLDHSLVRKVDPVTGAVSLFANAPPCTSCGGGPFEPPAPYLITGNSTDAFVVDSPPVVGSSFTQVGSASMRKISTASGDVQTVSLPSLVSNPLKTPNGIWADDHFLYLSYFDASGQTPQVGLGRMDLSTLQFVMVQGFPMPLVSSVNGGFAAAALSWVDSGGNLFFRDYQNVYDVSLASAQVSVVSSVPDPLGHTIAGLWGAGSFLFGTDSQANTVFKVFVSQSGQTTALSIVR